MAKSGMAQIIASVIEQEKDENGLSAGQAKYRQYFVKVSYFKKYRTECDNILILNGYGDCIVTE